MSYVLQIIGLVHGYPSPFDGQYLKEYDPGVNGVDALGNHMTAHVVTTPDPFEAMHFADTREWYAVWTAVDPRQPVRPDGKPNRPLTAFTVTAIAHHNG